MILDGPTGKHIGYYISRSEPRWGSCIPCEIRRLRKTPPPAPESLAPNGRLEASRSLDGAFICVALYPRCIRNCMCMVRLLMEVYIRMHNTLYYIYAYYISFIHIVYIIIYIYIIYNIYSIRMHKTVHILYICIL